jgi:hypothetical protein
MSSVMRGTASSECPGRPLGGRHEDGRGAEVAGHAVAAERDHQYASARAARAGENFAGAAPAGAAREGAR